MDYQELLQLVKNTPITQEELDELRTELIQQGIEGEERERRAGSSEVLNRTYNL